jgi:hypothetical protein
VIPAPDDAHVQESERAISVKKLLDMGRLWTGAILEATYLGQRHTAEVLPDGQIRYAGTVYKSLSAAGGAMVLAVKQPEEASDWVPSTDGWSFCRVKTGNLAGVLPRNYRRRLDARGLITHTCSKRAIRSKRWDLATLKEIRRRAAQKL